MITPFETIHMRAGMELLTLVIPTTKSRETQDLISRLDWRKSDTFTKLETFLMKNNGFIRE